MPLPADISTDRQEPGVEPLANTAPTKCRHCGLSIPSRRRKHGDEFCCDGCKRVYALIHEAGLDGYYDLRRGESGPPATLRPDSFTWLSPLLPEEESASTQPRRLTLDVQGIHCAACVWLLREMFLRRPGAIDLHLNPTLGKAEFTWIPAQSDLRGYLADAEAFGYRFGPDRKRAGGRSSGLVIRMGLCAAAAMNVMIFSFCFYAGLGPDEGRLYTLFGRLNLGLTTFAVLVGGWVFFRSAWQGLRRGLIHLDLPIALSILLAFAGSVYAQMTDGPRAAYFDTVAAFVTFMLVGRWLQERVIERNRNSLLASEGIDNLFARRMRSGRLESIPARDVERGDEIWVVPGDLLPTASIVLHHPAPMALDWITGESEVRSFQPGEIVPAGAFNASETAAHFAASEPFADSGLNELLGTPAGEGVEESTAHRSSGDRWWRRVGTIYVLAVLVLAASGFLLWMGRGTGRALEVTVAILAVTCPCALGLAIPLAQELAQTALRRRGIFIRRGSFLDRALHVRKIVFDKTGTVTLGRLVLDTPSQEALDALAPAERTVLRRMVEQSNHPMSRAILAALEEGGRPTDGAGRPTDDGATPANPSELLIREIFGQGLEALHGGRTWRLGRSSSNHLQTTTQTTTQASTQTTTFSRDGIPLASFAAVEVVKSDAAEEVRYLRDQGFEVFLWSGDSSEKTRAVAATIGIPEGAYAGGLDPQGKAAKLREVDREDTMMIGDGLNDAPSFAAAFCTATPAVDRPALPGRSDLYFLGDGIGSVRRALTMAAKLRGVVRGNLAFAVGYNAITLTACFLGLVDPLLAAILMPLSSVLVVSHTAWRLTGRRLAWMS